MPRGGRKKGADTHKDDRRVVPWLWHLCCVAERERGWSKFETIRRFTAPVVGPVIKWSPAPLPLPACLAASLPSDLASLVVLSAVYAGWGKTVNSVTHRLYQKMQNGRYGDAEIPPGIHYSHFTLDPPPEGRGLWFWEEPTF